MKRKFIAVILSALVVPGLGQLYLGRRIRAVILIMGVNIFLLVTVVLLMQTVVPTMKAMMDSGVISREPLLQAISGSIAIRWLAVVFVALWGYACADIFFGAPGDRESDSPQIHE